MQKIITPDGSVTFHNSQFDEAYHSKSGAKEEAVEKFVKPCLIREIAKTGKIKILDFCFGLGYNTAAAIDAALEENPHCVIEVVGLEIDEQMLQLLPSIPDSFRSYSFIKETIKDNYNYNKNNLNIQIVLGDAIETIKKLNGEYDAVFFDPFSPKKCPGLWTEDIFRECYRLLRKEGRLATYSCARVVRDNMRAVGFTVIDGPQLWRRGPSTIGVKE